MLFLLMRFLLSKMRKKNPARHKPLRRNLYLKITKIIANNYISRNQKTNTNDMMTTSSVS